MLFFAFIIITKTLPHLYYWKEELKAPLSQVTLAHRVHKHFNSQISLSLTVCTRAFKTPKQRSLSILPFFLSHSPSLPPSLPRSFVQPVWELAGLWQGNTLGKGSCLLYGCADVNSIIQIVTSFQAWLPDWAPAKPWHGLPLPRAGTRLCTDHSCRGPGVLCRSLLSPRSFIKPGVFLLAWIYMQHFSCFFFFFLSDINL